MATAVVTREVQVGAIQDFDALTEDAAKATLYDTVVPACEAEGVMLSGYGNHAGEGSSLPVHKYEALKAERTLFDVARVQRAYASIDALVRPGPTYQLRSEGLMHVFTKSQSSHLSNGDLIAAMLVKGYHASFTNQREDFSVNALFMAQIRESSCH